MPFYAFSNPSNPKEIIEVMQAMNDEHIYELNGVRWDRVFFVPQAFVKDSPIDPDSSDSFMRVTEGKKDKIGDVWDRSRELHEKRKKRYGYDPVERKADEAWSKARRGRKLPKKKSELVIRG